MKQNLVRVQNESHSQQYSHFFLGPLHLSCLLYGSVKIRLKSTEWFISDRRRDAKQPCNAGESCGLGVGILSVQSACGCYIYEQHVLWWVALSLPMTFFFFYKKICQVNFQAFLQGEYMALPHCLLGHKLTQVNGK